MGRGGSGAAHGGTGGSGLGVVSVVSGWWYERIRGPPGQLYIVVSHFPMPFKRYNIDLPQFPERAFFFYDAPNGAHEHAEQRICA